jgi:excisionase family DNA binding protein
MRGMIGLVEVARMCGVSRQTVRLWTAKGYLPAPVLLGRRKLWPVTAVQAWLEALRAGRQNAL